MKNFFTRTITGIILVALISLIIFSQIRFLLFILITLLSSACLWELFKVTKPEAASWHFIWAEASCIFLNLAGYYRIPSLMLSVWLISIFLLFVLSFREYPGEMKLIEQPLFLLVYIAFSWSFAYFYPIDHPTYLIMPFAVAWGTDTMAYLVGNWIGKKPLTKISPHKTVEGSVGGIFGSIILCLAFRHFFFHELSVLSVSILAILGSFVAQIGDIFASSIKRRMGIKDFGKILKGHGGIMDRFDSVILSIPFVWLYFLILF